MTTTMLEETAAVRPTQRGEAHAAVLDAHFYARLRARGLAVVTIAELDRLRALERRSRVVGYRCGPLYLDLRTRTLSRDGRDCALSAIEFRLVEALMEADGQVVGPEQLRPRIWPAFTPTETRRTLNANMCRLRKKVEPEVGRQRGPVCIYRIIRSVRGQGYYLAEPVVRVEQPAAVEQAL